MNDRLGGFAKAMSNGPMANARPGICVRRPLGRSTHALPDTIGTSSKMARLDQVTRLVTGQVGRGLPKTFRSGYA